MDNNQNENMLSDEEIEVISLVDEDGEEHDFELLDVYDDGSQKYAALVPISDSEDDGELMILKILEEDGEEVLEAIEDEDEFDRISEIFVDRLSDVFDFEDE